MADPVQAKHRETINALAAAIDEVLNGASRPKKLGFILLIAEFGAIEDGRVNYVSNGERADMTTMLRETLARFEGRTIDTPGHA